MRDTKGDGGGAPQYAAALTAGLTLSLWSGGAKARVGSKQSKGCLFSEKTRLKVLEHAAAQSLCWVRCEDEIDLRVSNQGRGGVGETAGRR